MIHLELKMPPDLRPSPESVEQQALEDEFWAETEAAELNGIEPTNVVSVAFRFGTSTGSVCEVFQMEGMNPENVKNLMADPTDEQAAELLVEEAFDRLFQRGITWFEDNDYRWARVLDINQIFMGYVEKNVVATCRFHH